MKKTNLRKLLLVGVLAIGSLGFSAVASAAQLSQEQAKAIVMKEVPNGQITKVEMDRDYGRAIYEIEVFDGDVERDYDIDAETGAILKVDMDHHRANKYAKVAQSGEPKVSYEQARAIAMKKSKGMIEDMELTYKNGVQVYDIDIEEGMFDREIIIDANTGKILRDRKDF